MSKEAGEVAVVEEFVLQLIDRAGKGGFLGDGGTVGFDEVDLGVIGAGPAARPPIASVIALVIALAIGEVTGVVRPIGPLGCHSTEAVRISLGG
ncbi:hypothetical protein [Streptomyces sp. NPDC059802]|uniref:hypothetical protein n=1 Tax=Streptomyces sp. NPDC059802 TaxID=3346952 RepID=UPI0036659F0D